MAETKLLAKGFFFSRREGAPSFVVAKMSVKVEEAIAFLEEHVNDRGYVNLDLLWNKDGDKITGFLDDWKPKEGYDSAAKKPRASGPVAEDDDDLPY